MSGMWKRSHGRTSEAPPDERGGYRYVRPTATAPHLDSTLNCDDGTQARGKECPRPCKNDSAGHRGARLMHAAAHCRIKDSSRPLSRFYLRTNRDSQRFHTAWPPKLPFSAALWGRAQLDEEPPFAMCPETVKWSRDTVVSLRARAPVGACVYGDHRLVVRQEHSK